MLPRSKVNVVFDMMGWCLATKRMRARNDYTEETACPLTQVTSWLLGMAPVVSDGVDPRSLDASPACRLSGMCKSPLV